MTGLGTYQPGTSVLHRLPAAVKLTGLAAAMLGLLWVRDLPALGVAALLVAGGYALAQVPPGVALAQVWPLRWLALAVGAFQVLVEGWERAVLVVGSLLLAVALAALVTLTTRVADLLDVLERCLRRVPGVDAARVALVAALGIRAVPVVAGLAAEVREAQRARGLPPSPRLWAVPLVVRTLRRADQLGDALAARGLDD